MVVVRWVPAGPIAETLATFTVASTICVSSGEVPPASGKLNVRSSSMSWMLYCWRVVFRVHTANGFDGTVVVHWPMAGSMYSSVTPEVWLSGTWIVGWLKGTRVKSFCFDFE